MFLWTVGESVVDSLVVCAVVITLEFGVMVFNHGVATCLHGQLDTTCRFQSHERAKRRHVMTCMSMLRMYCNIK